MLGDQSIESAHDLRKLFILLDINGAHLVGGALRDEQLLGEVPRDYDICFNNERDYEAAISKLRGAGFAVELFNAVDYGEELSEDAEAFTERWLEGCRVGANIDLLLAVSTVRSAVSLFDNTINMWSEALNVQGARAVYWGKALGVAEQVRRVEADRAERMARKAEQAGWRYVPHGA